MTWFTFPECLGRHGAAFNASAGWHHWRGASENRNTVIMVVGGDGIAHYWANWSQHCATFIYCAKMNLGVRPYSVVVHIIRVDFIVAAGGATLRGRFADQPELISSSALPRYCPKFCAENPRETTEKWWRYSLSGSRTIVYLN